MCVCVCVRVYAPAFVSVGVCVCLFACVWTGCVSVYVYVCVVACVFFTSTLCLGGSGLEARGTLTDVGPGCVDAFSVRTRVSVTFIVV